MKEQKIEIKLANGYKLVAEQNCDTEYANELYIGILNPDNVWLQDLAIVRSSYNIIDEEVVWDENQFEVLVYADSCNEDYTNKFTIDLCKE